MNYRLLVCRDARLRTKTVKIQPANMVVSNEGVMNTRIHIFQAKDNLNDEEKKEIERIICISESLAESFANGVLAGDENLFDNNDIDLDFIKSKSINNMIIMLTDLDNIFGDIKLKRDKFSLVITKEELDFKYVLEI